MKYLLISILCFGITIPFLTTEKKDTEAIYEEYHELMLNNFDLTYEGKANNEDLKRTLRASFPNIFDEVVTVHLYKNTGNNKFKYVYKIDGFKSGKESAAAVNANKIEYETLTFTSHCPNSRPCLGVSEVAPCKPETQFGVICGCFDIETGTCDIF